MKPYEIEKRSFEIITEILGDRKLEPKYEHIVKRCIHTSADFDYVDNLCFSENFDEISKSLKEGALIITDTNMVKSGINKKACEKYGVEVMCFISDEDVANSATKNQTTRAHAAIDKAYNIKKPIVFAIGNAPTALIRLHELYEEKNFRPSGIIGVPVGFVNVVESKEMIIKTDIPFVVAKGRKGGSNIAACICNAILYN